MISCANKILSRSNKILNHRNKLKNKIRMSLPGFRKYRLASSRMPVLIFNVFSIPCTFTQPGRGEILSCSDEILCSPNEILSCSDERLCCPNEILSCSD